MELARKTGVSMPITEQLNEILFNNGSVKDALDNLMSSQRNLKQNNLYKSIANQNVRDDYS